MTHAVGPARLRGFTLLELLVVVLIIGLLTSMAMLGLQSQSPRERVEEEAQRLLARMELAREEAVLRAQSLGVRFEDDDTYRFLALREERWRRHSDRLFQPHALPEGMHLEINIDGLEVELAGSRGDGGGTDNGPGAAAGGDSDEDDGDERQRPQIFFLAGGEIEPDFSIRVVGDGLRTEYLIEPGTREWLTLSEQRL
jgi:general secretion pathway protein H